MQKSLRKNGMNKSTKFKVRPAGRHLLTIGRDLIQDNYAAIVELVKNAYDADSKSVNINFYFTKDFEGNIQKIKIVIKDYGHGMSSDTVLNKWMVPSTTDKLTRKISPNGRVMQGRKGIGRYAASILGSTLILETISEEREKTIVSVNWEEFEQSEYLEDVELKVITEESNDPHGTTLTIEGDQSFCEQWTDKQFNKLKFELKKLMSPIDESINKETTDFKINLKILGFSEKYDVDEIIEPYPIFELFDYKISGKISEDGKGALIYSHKKVKNSEEERIDIDLGEETNCGSLFFDIRVYDREVEAIDQLINRGLKDNQGNFIGKLEARNLLNEYNSVGVYRNGFRIRPLGDSDFDWLKLNEQRVQNPSLRIGSNQVIGYVLIESEDKSDLIEKSARDGLIDNLAYEKLREITKDVIGELENRRFSLRRKIGLGKQSIKLQKEIYSLFSFKDLTDTIRKKLEERGVDEKFKAEILGLINKEEESKNKFAEDIKQSIAVYQGQATLGKIMNVVLHEGRKPLNYFQNEVPRISRFINKYQKTNDFDNINKIISISDKTVKNAEIFSILFKRLDPLAAGKRPPKQILNIRQEIISCFEVFRKIMMDNKINFEINGDANIIGWKPDIYAIFTNLIDNSIYWLIEKQSDKRLISVNISPLSKDNINYIDFRDTGPGIESYLIENNTIFEPQFSTKSNGTGIGLPIAGEAAERNGMKLIALDCNDGAYFRLENKELENI